MDENRVGAIQWVVCYGLTSILFSNAPAWSGRIINHSCFGAIALLVDTKFRMPMCVLVLKVDRRTGNIVGTETALVA